jgi:hypothetical protein
MTSRKDLKRLIRGRMLKTGEAYTTARAQILKQKPARRRSAEAASSRYAQLAGKSDATLAAKTGSTWARWVAALDRVKADNWTHTEIARYVQEKYKISGWWAQTVTVAYERIKGLRAVGQRDGWFEANKSKTMRVPISRLYEAFDDSAIRGRWLPEVQPTIRTKAREKSMRITWSDGTLVIAGFTSMGPAKSQVAITHAKLPDQAAITRSKQYWAERLAALERLLHERSLGQ